jgi:predicted nuclease of predicted toxin-antitoxin system
VKRILLDQGLAPATAIILRQDGWDAIHVGDIGLERALDPEILEAARLTGRTCITLDLDFHSHLALTRAGRPSVVLLRIQGLDAAGQASLIRAIWAGHEQILAQGAAISANNTSVRVRRLPLIANR